jgi:hypothetical protein
VAYKGAWTGNTWWSRSSQGGPSHGVASAEWRARVVGTGMTWIGAGERRGAAGWGKGHRGDGWVCTAWGAGELATQVVFAGPAGKEKRISEIPYLFL